ncbi:hypothetical protein AVEN_48733-1 [Araneus ventricosus]|uniref:Peptidase aspartic putative domain-containing protein n=1 Tax=Araneus ventricosus TaxID=182803 RepID=A0A4Y2T1L0_ARAVE|nr:hypothetical protein AVEN_48733-1 [Araneus ventricosus]
MKYFVSLITEVKNYSSRKTCPIGWDLKELSLERLNIYSFGSKTPKKQTCRKVEVRLKNVLSGCDLGSGNFKGNTQPSERSEMESRGFRLTFSCSESSENYEISLLIGSDFYWSLTNRIKKDSIHHWLLSRPLWDVLFRASAMSGVIVLRYI